MPWDRVIRAIKRSCFGLILPTALVALALSVVAALPMGGPKSNNALDNVCPKPDREVYSAVASPDGTKTAFKVYCYHAESFTTALLIETRSQKTKINVFSTSPQAGPFGSDGVIFYWTDDHILNVAYPDGVKIPDGSGHAGGVKIQYKSYNPVWAKIPTATSLIPSDRVTVSFSKTPGAGHSGFTAKTGSVECSLKIDGKLPNNPGLVSANILADVYPWRNSLPTTIAMLDLEFTIIDSVKPRSETLTLAKWADVIPDFAGIDSPRQISDELLYRQYNTDLARKILKDVANKTVLLSFRSGLSSISSSYTLSLPASTQHALNDFLSCISGTNLYGGGLGNL